MLEGQPRLPSTPAKKPLLPQAPPQVMSASPVPSSLPLQPGPSSVPPNMPNFQQAVQRAVALAKAKRGPKRRTRAKAKGASKKRRRDDRGDESSADDGGSSKRWTKDDGEACRRDVCASNQKRCVANTCHVVNYERDKCMATNNLES